MRKNSSKERYIAKRHECGLIQFRGIEDLWLESNAKKSYKIPKRTPGRKPGTMLRSPFRAKFLRIPGEIVKYELSS
jgi:hypothetical protein